MRAAILGVFSVARGLDVPQLRELNRVSTRITHTDIKAEYGAFAVALAARYALQSGDEFSPHDFLRLLRENVSGNENADEFLLLMEKVGESVAGGETVSEFTQNMGWKKGASGYIYHTVPAALHVWLRHSKDYRAGVLEIIGCGGDTDSTAAIVGGLIGATVGAEGIPREWREGLMEWPRGVAWMDRLAARLAHVCRSGQAQKTLPVFWPAVLARNIFFLAVVFAHALRRRLPV
jgi:ADP-ribosylglycohydrolase